MKIPIIFSLLLITQNLFANSTLSFKGEPTNAIQLMLVNPDGKKTGYDIKTSSVVIEIPHSSYMIGRRTNEDDDNGEVYRQWQDLYVRRPMDGKYVLYVIGTSSGNLALNIFCEDKYIGMSGKDITKPISKNEIFKIYVNYSSDPNKKTEITEDSTSTIRISDYNISPSVIPEYNVSISPDGHKVIFSNIKNNEIKKEILLYPKISENDESGLEPIGWSSDGRYFWSGIGEADFQPNPFYKIDTNDFSFKEYNIDIVFGEYNLNKDNSKIVLSDYPMVYDSYSREELIKNKTKVTLYIYNLVTKEKKVIDISAGKWFKPKWIDNNTIEYNNPKGKDRIKYKIGK